MTIKAVKSVREKGRYDLHLREGTTENPQPADARHQMEAAKALQSAQILRTI